MSSIDPETTRPIESTRELRQYFLDSCKPHSDWRVGTEHELIGVRNRGDRIGSAPAYDGTDGIRAVLEGLAASGWSPVREEGHIIALERGDEQVTLEPGGQFELASRPVNHADELKADLETYYRELCEPTRRLGLSWLAIGFRPFGRIADVSWMPKGRYVVMREYLPGRGALAHEMMKRTATVQVNLDYGDPDDAAEKMRAAMSVTSILTAIFANSPIVDEADSGYQSYRARVWLDTDPDRCGLLDFVFKGGDIFDAYTEWALDVPLFFVHRERYIPAGGMTFRQFIRDGFQGHRATMDDWALHLSTLFPEARMKRYIEVRGCDCGPTEMVLALAPLCRGLLYDRDARQAATALTESLDMNDRRQLQADVARHGFAARVEKTGHRVGELATQLVSIASGGLERELPSELPYLAPLREIVESGRTRADTVRELWNRHRESPQDLVAALAHGSPECG